MDGHYMHQSSSLCVMISIYCMVILIYGILCNGISSMYTCINIGITIICCSIISMYSMIICIYVIGMYMIIIMLSIIIGIIG